jgi:acetyl-CoA carboxylase biotin carboxyl carrier protein
MADKKSNSQFEKELALVRAMAKVLEETGLSEIEIEREDVSVRVACGTKTVVATAAPTPAAQPSDPASIAQGSAASAVSDPGAVKSPMVGTAYLAPTPGSEPFIKIGDQVSEGQTLLIVEAMKTMNEIKAPKSGTIRQILARDAEPVEFDEPLVIIG